MNHFHLGKIPPYFIHKQSRKIFNEVNTLIPANDVAQLQIKNSSTADKTDVTYFKYDRNFVIYCILNLNRAHNQVHNDKTV